MPTLMIEDPTTEEPTSEEMLGQQDAAAAQRLRAETAAVRLSFTWPGVTKTLTREQKATAADPFGADSRSLSAGKKLLDTSHPAFREVTAVRGRITSYWKEQSVPYPEPGVRLVPRGRIAELDARLQNYQQELQTAVGELSWHFQSLKDTARQRLGELYDETDYPADLAGLFAVTWDYPAVEPPEYLRRLSPRLYAEECGRARTRFAEAVRLAEEAFTAEFGKLVAHLCERLSGGDDGKPKVFRDSVVGNLEEFFNRFRSLNVGSNADLERLIEQAQRVVGGVEPGELRTDVSLRQQVAAELTQVQSTLDDLLVERPRRNILRRPR